MADPRLPTALAAIDAANAADPNCMTVDGVERPKELAHAEMVTEWVRRLRPDPSEALLLAARAHHLRRWAVPRSTYPDGRAGYLRWRRDMHQRHAEETDEADQSDRDTEEEPVDEIDPGTAERVDEARRRVEEQLREAEKKVDEAKRKAGKAGQDGAD